ncbi:hypothetical protein EVAR_74678_1 [Eumeta japonica]|uniref:Uncharacterized protein n=1 Tax=Eumeta variegata TaxID=151549 RepID=A0A4C1TJJ9_EUMVA|nr:hypothetical protein EVAR_74678_1 [Eumeta japonica]
MRSFRGNGTTNIGVTLDKIYTSEIISAWQILHFSTKQGSGPCSVEKSKLSRRNKRTIYKMCIRTVMTYASPSSLHQKQYIDYRTPHISKYMKDASKRFFDIAGSHPNARAVLSSTASHPPYPWPETYLPIHLTLLAAVESLNDVNDADGLGRKEPTRDGFLRHLCRDDFHQASSIAHVAPSALACAVGHSVKLSRVV